MRRVLVLTSAYRGEMIADCGTESNFIFDQRWSNEHIINYVFEAKRSQAEAYRREPNKYIPQLKRFCRVETWEGYIEGKPLTEWIPLENNRDDLN